MDQLKVGTQYNGTGKLVSGYNFIKIKIKIVESTYKNKYIRIL